MKNSIKFKFEPCGVLVDEAYSRYNANMSDNQDPFSQTGNDETGKALHSSNQDNEKMMTF